jgi:hypothetical protein
MIWCRMFWATDNVGLNVNKWIIIDRTEYCHEVLPAATSKTGNLRCNLTYFFFDSEKANFPKHCHEAISTANHCYTGLEQYPIFFITFPGKHGKCIQFPSWIIGNFVRKCNNVDRLCGLVVRAPGFRSRVPLTSPTSGSRSVSIVRSRTQAMEFSFF